MNEDAVRGLPVYGVGDGRELGRVRHVYLDPGSQRVVALGVLPPEVAPEEAPGALDPTGAAFVAVPRGLTFLPTAAVRSIGADAVMVADAAALEAEAPAGEAELVALDALDGRGVVAQGGGEVGQFAGAEFDPTSFALTGIEVGRGLLRRRSHLPAAMVHDLRSDPIVVAAEADPAALRPAKPARAERREAPAEKRSRPESAPARTRVFGRGRSTVEVAAVADPVGTGTEPRKQKTKKKSAKAPKAPRGERKAAEAGGA